MEWIMYMIKFENDATLDNFNFHKWKVYDTCFPGKKTHWKLISIQNKLNFPYQKTSIHWFQPLETNVQGTLCEPSILFGDIRPQVNNLNISQTLSYLHAHMWKRRMTNAYLQLFPQNESINKPNTTFEKYWYTKILKYQSWTSWHTQIRLLPTDRACTWFDRFCHEENKQSTCTTKGP